MAGFDAAMMERVFLSGPQRRMFARGLPVLVYHSLGAPPRGVCDPFLYVGAEQFDAQLAALREAGLKSGSLDELGATGSVVLSFDDGCANVFAHALGPLARHGFRAIEFVVAGLIGGCNEWDVKHGDAPVPLMDAVQLREWLAAGHTIGSHGLTHRNLTRCTEAEAREEIFASRNRLEDEFGIEVRHFCYPHGRWNERVRDLVGEAGYATACTMDFGVNALGADPLALRRIAPLSAGELLRKALHRLCRKLGRT